MRIGLVLSLLLPLTATAQVATDDHALDSLQPAAAAPKPQSKVAKPASSGRAAVHRPARPKAAAPTRKPGTVTMPAAPPANPVIAPPPFVMPPHPAPPPPPIPVRADALGAVAPLPHGLRIAFGPGTADMNPAMLAAIRVVAARAVAHPAEQLSVTAWAPGTTDDPSTPRRLSLDRALSVRAVLINAGVVSDRIRTVAKGMSDYGDGIADRADLLELPPAS